jgi:nucleotide-binding universal stress UspA family protein
VAFALAERLDSDLVGCHIRPHRYSEVKMPALLGGAGSEWTLLTKGWNAKKLSRDAQTLFEKAAARADCPVATKPRADGSRVAIWQERVGSPDKLMPIVGPMSDLLVVSRPAARGGRLASIFLSEALMHSCRPVLVLPQKKVSVPGRRILVAWNQSPEASRALAATMPLLEMADAVTLAVAGTENAPGPKSGQVVSYLQHHGIRAEVLRSRGHDVAGEIEAAFRASGADLLMMGAYSRHRLRERVFGGVTHHMLTRSALPVLMYHS